MKKNICFFCLLIPLILTSIYSCSNIPDNAELEKIISAHEKKHLKDMYNLVSYPCGHGKTLKIPKHFEWTSIVKNAFDPNDTYEVNNARAKLLLDYLAIDGIISITKTEDKTFFNFQNNLVRSQKYDIQPTNAGNELVLVDTGEEYLFSLVDVNKIDVLKTTKVADDTLIVDYKIHFSAAFQGLKKICSLSENNYLPKDSSTATLVKENGEWKRKW